MKLIEENNFTSFSYYSQLAAKAEIAREYEVAMPLWRKAAFLAKNNRNIEWAVRRKRFCSKRMQ
ncbi:ANR family transcriptional regulator [Escherichia coli]|uniref:ANR family transcriptional regulator n=1 Tax=Escherichia coli TaxID=562 RepID=UPI001B8BA8C9|nr:ANR family transcriptional regulator [Escherichia coli]